MLSLRPFERAHTEAMGGTATADDPGVAFTLFDNGRQLGCGGLVPMGETVGAWLELTDEIRARPFTLHRLIRRVLACKWLVRLGFRQIGEEDGFVRFQRG